MKKNAKIEKFPSSDIPLDEEFLRSFKSLAQIEDYLKTATAPDDPESAHSLYGALALKEAVKAIEERDGNRFYDPKINFLGPAALYFVHKTKPARYSKYTLDRHELVTIYNIAVDIVKG